MTARKLTPPHDWGYYGGRCARCGARDIEVADRDGPCITDGEAADRVEWMKEADAAARAMRRVAK